MNKELWTKILDFNPDYPFTEYGFSTRLADENYWTRNFTIKAITEYKKFMYLAATTDFMVSPSEIVDAVWHQHLIFTQSYNALCNTIGKNIQHVPSTHNKEEIVKFRLAKERTRKMYNEVFGEQPKDIWDYNDMFEPLALPKLKYKIRTFIIIGILLFFLAVAPCYFLLRPVYVHIDNPWFLTCYVTIFAASLFFLEVNNRLYLQRVVGQWQPFTFIYDLSPLELVYLKTGKLADVVHGVVNEFINQKKIVLNSNSTLQLNYYGQQPDAEGWALLDAVQGLEPVLYPVLVGQLVQKPIFANIANCMNAFRKYFSKSKAFGKLFYSNFIFLLVLLMFGFIRLLTGIMRDKPVQFISLALIVIAVAAGAFLWRVANLVCSDTIPQLYKKSIIPTIDNVHDWDWQYFLGGIAVLSAAFMPSVERMNNTSSSSGGSGGCGGGGSCGGGCGGCGGG